MSHKNNLLLIVKFFLLIFLGSWATAFISGCATNDIYKSAFYGDVPAIEVYLSNGGDINAKAPKYPYVTMLIEAACSGKIEVVRLLLSKGADVNAKDDDGRSALLCAATAFGTEKVSYDKLSPRNKISQFTDILGILLANGADIDAVNSLFGDSAMHIAAGRGKIEILSYLVNEKHQSPNMLNKSNRTPLRDKSGDTYTELWEQYGADEYAKRVADGKSSNSFLKAFVMVANTAIAASYDLPVEQQTQIITATAHDLYSDGGSKSELAAMMNQNMQQASSSSAMGQQNNQNTSVLPENNNDCSLAGNYEDNPSGISSWKSRMTLGANCKGGSYCVQTINPDWDYARPNRNDTSKPDYDWYCDDSRTIAGGNAFEIDSWKLQGGTMLLVTKTGRNVTMNVDKFPGKTCINRMCSTN